MLPLVVDRQNKSGDSMEFLCNPVRPNASDGMANSSPANASVGIVCSASSSSPAAWPPTPSRYESHKGRDWNTFGQYLKNHCPPLPLEWCSGVYVLKFLRYLEKFGETKLHTQICPLFGNSSPPTPCPCPFRQALGSLDSLVGRVRATFEENDGRPESNPFGARAVKLYLREVRDLQSKARGISYEKKKRPTTAS